MVSHNSYLTGKKRLTRWGVSFEGRNYTGFGDFIWSAVIHVHSGKKENVTLLGDPGSHSLHDFAVDRLLIVGNKVLV